MAKKPLLVFPKPSANSRNALSQRFGGSMRYPTLERQVELLDEKITELERVLQNKTAYLGANPAGLVPEMILVLEIAGNLTDFYNAVRQTQGFDFLAELESDIEPDDDFYSVDRHNAPTGRRFGARVFLTMTNNRALQQLQRYWVNFKAGREFLKGTAKFRTLFEHLKDIRPYSVTDRIYDTGLTDYLDECRQMGEETLRFEIELAYRTQGDINENAFESVSRMIQEAGGEVIAGSRVIIPEIYYHAFIAETPLAIFDDLTEDTNVTLLKSQQILFFRPVGQSVIFSDDAVTSNEAANPIEFDASSEEPVIALLDGMPLQNHVSLNGRIRVDDPDEYAQNYLAENRIHGTVMASLILNGDLGEDDRPLSRSIYVRPILKSITNTFYREEALPSNVLPVDLIHRAVRRLFEGDETSEPVAPNIKLINFSIGDPYRPFHQNISTWAKLLDWLSHKYNVLFIISAGNCVDEISIDIPAADFDTTSADDIRKATIRKIVETNFARKILTPAESINSLTIGSAHGDACAPASYGQRINLLDKAYLPSPVSRIGFGFHNSIKPELLMPGGIQLYRKHPVQRGLASTSFRVESQTAIHTAPGNKVALPGLAGELNKLGYLTGTSNAAALTTRLGGKLYEMLLELNQELPDEQKMPGEYFTVLIKALLVHGASWGDAKKIFSEVVATLPGVSPQNLKKHITPYLGYGLVDTEKIMYCTDHRVTMLGFGKISTGKNKSAHAFTLPLPPSLASKNIDKKLVITLAWLTPINLKNAQYRKAHLFIDNVKENGYLTLNRDNHDFDISKRGTVQHDILTGQNADVFLDGDSLIITVNCRKDASKLSAKDEIRYGIAVTLEIQENVHTMIYDEVRARLQQRIRERV